MMLLNSWTEKQILMKWMKYLRTYPEWNPSGSWWNRNRNETTWSEQATMLRTCWTKPLIVVRPRHHQPPSFRNKSRLVVLGAGWAGFRLAKDVDKSKYDVTVVSPRNHFLFTPLLPSTSVGTLEFRCVQEPVRTIKGKALQLPSVLTLVIHENIFSHFSKNSTKNRTKTKFSKTFSRSFSEVLLTFSLLVARKRLLVRIPKSGI